MKALNLILVLVFSMVPSRSDEINITVPINFDSKSLAKYELSWGGPHVGQFTRVKLQENNSRNPIVFEGSNPTEVMLSKDSKYLCTLKLNGNRLILPNVVKLKIDYSAVINGTIWLQSIDGMNCFYKNLILNKSETFLMAANGSPVAIFYKSHGHSVSRQVGVFTVDFNTDYNIYISIDKDSDVVISTKFNILKEK